MRNLLRLHAVYWYGYYVYNDRSTDLGMDQSCLAYYVEFLYELRVEHSSEAGIHILLIIPSFLNGMLMISY